MYSNNRPFRSRILLLIIQVMTDHILYGLIGYPLAHSFSADYFNAKFIKHGIEASYINFPIERVDEIKDIVESHKELAGLNVTIPYKEKIIPFLTGLDKKVTEIGAVNVIRVVADGDSRSFYGYNTDAIGFMESIRPLITERMTAALVLGTGGASKAITYGLRQLGLSPLLVSRTPKEGILGYNELDEEIMKSHLVIVNTTPLGTFPDVGSCPPIPYELLSDSHLCYDLVYNPAETLFLKKSKAQGAIVKNGLEMLHLQAEEAWRIWNSRI